MPEETLNVEKNSESPLSSQKYWLMARVALAVAVFILVGGIVYSRLGSVSPEENLVPVAFVSAETRGRGVYPNGSYTTVGEYAPHGIPTQVEVTVTLKDDTVILSDVTLLTDDPISVRMTDKFQEGYKPLVIGKPIQGLELGVVSGSSLTPIGYNAALRQIERYAATL